MKANKTSRRYLAAAVALLGLLLLALALASCGGGETTGPPPNPVPTLSSIAPDNAMVGGAGFTLTVTGTNFISSSKVRWKGASRTTTFVSATQLTATISALDIALGGTADVTVFNPAPGGGASGAKTFTINNPVPTITGIVPTNAVAGTAGFTLTVNGTNFVSISVVRWNGSDRTTTFGSSTQLTAAISAADIAAAGSAQVTVFNPTPAGGETGGTTFNILVAAPVAVKTTKLPDTAGNKAYDVVLSSTGGVPPVSWSISAGVPPPSLALDPASGRVSGTVDPVGVDTTFNFTVRATDSAAPPSTMDQPLSITVRAGALGLNDACTPGSAAGTTAISNGTIRASISPYGDVDVYSFQGTAGSQVTIEIFALRLDLDGNPATRDSWLDSILELLDSNCQVIALDDDSVRGGVVQDSLIRVSSSPFPDPCPPPSPTTPPCADVPPPTSLPYSGTYFIRVRDFRGDGRPDLIYELSLSGAN